VRDGFLDQGVGFFFFSSKTTPPHDHDFPLHPLARLWQHLHQQQQQQRERVEKQKQQQKKNKKKKGITRYI